LDPETVREAPDRKGSPSAIPCQSITPFQRGGGSSGWSWARTAEYSPSAPTSTSKGSRRDQPVARSVSSTLRVSNDATIVPVRTASLPSRSWAARSRIICSSPR
jgi:hypothetical protein